MSFFHSFIHSFQECRYVSYISLCIMETRIDFQTFIKILQRQLQILDFKITHANIVIEIEIISIDLSCFEQIFERFFIIFYVSDVNISKIYVILCIFWCEINRALVILHRFIKLSQFLAIQRCLLR